MPLHSDATNFLSSLAEQDPPGWHELSPAQGREIFASLAVLFGEKPGIETVEDYWLSSDDVRADDGSAAKSSEVRIRLFQDENPTDKTIVYFHGGGWVLGSVETHDALCRKIALASHATVISVDYRLSPEAHYPQPLDDCTLAVKAIVAHTDKLACGGTIVLAGDSAGGNLALATALRLRDDASVGSEVSAVALAYPVVQADFETESYRKFATGHGLTRETMQWFWQQYLGKAQPDGYANLLDAPLAGLPKTFVLTAEFDVLRDEGVQLAEKLSDAGVEVTHSEYAGQLHGFVHFAGAFKKAESAIAEIANFVGEV